MKEKSGRDFNPFSQADFFSPKFWLVSKEKGSKTGEIYQDLLMVLNPEIEWIRKLIHTDDVCLEFKESSRNNLDSFELKFI